MFFVAKICKRALRASIEGYLGVAASTPTYSSLADVGKSNQCTLLWFTLSAFPNFTAHPDASAGEIKIGGRSGSFVTPQKRDQDEVAPAFGTASIGVLRNNNHLISFCTGHILCCPNAFIWEPCTPARQVILMHLKS